VSGDYREASIEVRRDIKEHCRTVMADCNRIGRYAEKAFSDWPGRGIENMADGLVVAIFARSINTFTCALRNARLGYGAQAAMLNRSLFEDMADTHWIAADPETAEARYADHHDHSRMLLAEAVATFPDFYPDLSFPDFDPAERKRLNDLYTPYGTRPWSLLNLHERVRLIKDQWENESSQETLRFMHAIAHRENNQTLHVSAQSLNAVVETDERGRPAFLVGPQHAMVRRAIFGSYWTFTQTVTAVIDRFGFSMTPKERQRMFSEENFNRPDSSEGLLA
jgi:hypothetical protein